MRVLIDTHAFLWFALDDPSFSATAKRTISDPANEVEISPATYWELAIKVGLGKYALTEPFLPFIEKQIAVNRLRILHILPRHAAVVVTLPLHHKDPFDRLLIAQAIAENIPVVSADPVFDRYPVARIW
jgi:PIN domain nuclease of toxin-antitoxin system